MREREKERETASIDVFSRQIVYQQKKRERERNTHLYKIVIAQNLRHTKETPFT